MSDTITCRLVDVEIARGREVLTVSVPKHEVDVLRAVHGLDRVKEVGDSIDEMELSRNADAEYSRMQRKYARPNSADPVGIAYRLGVSQLEAFGFEMGRSNGEAAPQSGVRRHLPAPAAEVPDKPGKK